MIHHTVLEHHLEVVDPEESTLVLLEKTAREHDILTAIHIHQGELLVEEEITAGELNTSAAFDRRWYAPS